MHVLCWLNIFYTWGEKCVNEQRRIISTSRDNSSHFLATLPDRRRFLTTCVLNVCADGLSVYLRTWLSAGRCRRTTVWTGVPEWRRPVRRPWASPPRNPPASNSHSPVPTHIHTHDHVNIDHVTNKWDSVTSHLLAHTLNTWSACSSWTLLFSCRATMPATSSPGWDFANSRVNTVGQTCVCWPPPPPCSSSLGSSMNPYTSSIWTHS